MAARLGPSRIPTHAAPACDVVRTGSRRGACRVPTVRGPWLDSGRTLARLGWNNRAAVLL